jgi:hypothetical protein
MTGAGKGRSLIFGCVAATFALAASCRTNHAHTPACPRSTASPNVGQRFSSLRDVFYHYETQGFTMLGKFGESEWPATLVREQSAANEIALVLKNGQVHRYPGYTGYMLKVAYMEDERGGETVVVLRSQEQGGRAPGPSRPGIGRSDADVPGAGSAEQPGVPPEPARPSVIGRQFSSLQELVNYYQAQGFVTTGRFEKAQWPAKVVYEKQAANELTFTLKSGQRHRYTGFAGYLLKVVSLEDEHGRETVVVLRSKEPRFPASQPGRKRPSVL